MLASTGLFLVAGYVLPFVYGAPFSGSVSSLRLLLAGALFSSLARVISVFVVTQGKMLYNVIAVTAGVVVTLILDVLLIPLYGIVGASIATSVSYFAILIVLILVLRFKLGIKELNFFIPNGGDWKRIIERLKL